MIPHFGRAVARRAGLANARRPFAAATQKVLLNYQEPPPAGKKNGRYINQLDRGDAVDVAAHHEATMHNGRLLAPPATLESMGFALKTCPSAVKDFRDDAEVVKIYYEEMRKVIKEASGADSVLIFDHTIRESGNANLNAAAGGSAAPVPRVHCDYTAEGSPRRLKLLGNEGINSLIRGRVLTEAEVDALAAKRYAFINVWRSIDRENPVYRMPLAVCDEKSVQDEERFLYELMFPDRTGENYSLKFSENHKWYYYPEQQFNEVLIFKVFDKKEDGPRFVFHTAFEDPSCPQDAPSRTSLEARAIAFFTADDANDDFDEVTPSCRELSGNCANPWQCGRYSGVHTETADDANVDFEEVTPSCELSENWANPWQCGRYEQVDTE